MATYNNMTGYGGIFENDSSTNDTLNVYANDEYGGETGQFHGYAGAGNDILNLKFNNITSGQASGHHVWGDENFFAKHDKLTKLRISDEARLSPQYGNDEFHFSGFDQVSGTVVGRLNDFDVNRDKIFVEGVEIDMNNLLAHSNVHVVFFNGDHQDPNSEDQQYLIIETAAGGHIFYALEGARLDLVGTLNGGNADQENHFIRTQTIPDFDSLIASSSINAFVDQNDYLAPNAPSATNGGVVIQDADKFAGDLRLDGTSGGDVIAAGLNDDEVYAKGGNDHVWGGSGHDYVHGGDGNDYIEGNAGNDTLIGAKGNDTIDGGIGDDNIQGWKGDDDLWGGDGDDSIYGGNGADTIDGGKGVDSLYGDAGHDHIQGRSGDDKIWGGDGDDYLRGNWGDDRLAGGAGKDHLVGNRGEDEFIFVSGDMVAWGNGANAQEKAQNLDFIEDFNTSEDAYEDDKIIFKDIDGVQSLDDLSWWKIEIDGDLHYRLFVSNSESSEYKNGILIDVDDAVVKSYEELEDGNNFARDILFTDGTLDFL